MSAGIITSPKIVALDSSQWANLVRDANSSDIKLRRSARSFPDELLGCGCCLLFSIDHLKELMAIADEQILIQRLEFIRSIKFLAWLGWPDKESGLGSIVDMAVSS